MNLVWDIQRFYQVAKGKETDEREERKTQEREKEPGMILESIRSMSQIKMK